MNETYYPILQPFFWSSAIMNCMFVTFKDSLACGLGGVSGVVFLFPLMNSFNKTEAVIFPLHAMLPDTGPVSQNNLNKTSYFKRPAYISG